IRDFHVTGVQTCALPISRYRQLHESPYMAANGHHREANFSNPRFEDIQASQTNGIRSSYTLEGFVDYQKTFGGIHSINVIAGGKIGRASCREREEGARGD